MTLRLVDNELIPEEGEMEFIYYSENIVEHTTLFNNIFDSFFSKAFFFSPMFQCSYSCHLNNSVNYYSRFLNQFKLQNPDFSLPLETFRGRTLLSEKPNKLPIPKSSKLPDTLKDFSTACQLVSSHYQKEFPNHSRHLCDIQAERDVVRSVGVDTGFGLVKYYQMANDHKLESVDAKKRNSIMREQDYLFPITNVSRIMKTVLPEYTKVSTEAKMCMQECVSEFVNFISSEANEICSSQKRKIITTEDVLTAEYNLGFLSRHESLAAFSNQIKKLL